MTDFKIDQTKLDKLAEVAVRVGLNLQEGQDLVLTAPVGALPLARKVVETAYRAGAGQVTTILADEEITLARYRYGHDLSFDRAPNWLYDGMAAAYSSNAARMAISGDNPMLLAEQDPEKVARANKANAKAYRPAAAHITNFDINWNICPYPGESWAKQMFPDLPADEAVARLADAIFAACRADQPDPVAAWAEHTAELRRRTKWLNEKAFHALHYAGPGTDLTIGMADGHKWVGGAARAKNGVTCIPNMPTEEVFSTPHALRCEGTVRASKPLAHQGTVIEDIAVRFEGGQIVEAKASKGENVFLKLLDSDEGARRLGEVALVPHSSPISKSGLLFYNTLFDENAACHVALGRCYSECFDAHYSDEEVRRRGGNDSIIHVDWMIGNGALDIDGLDEAGNRTPVFRKGEWAF